jgi:hypothetical protein
MAKDEKKENNDGNKGVNNYLKFTGMGFQMIAIIGVFAFIGYKIDDAGHHSVKWATAAFSLAGVFISLYLVIRAVSSR